MLVLLTHANHFYDDRKQVRKAQPYPPLQTLIAAAHLRENGVDVALFDATFNRDFEAALDQFKPDLMAVCEDNFTFLTKMCLMQNRRLAMEMSEACKQRQISCVVNSSDSTDHPREYLAAGFERVIVGELEATLLDMCRQWPRPVAGSVGEAGREPRREPIRDLDSLPLPAWDLVDMSVYRDLWTAEHGYFSLNLVTSRGCPYRCNWCAKPLYGDSYRHYSPRRAASELRSVKQLFQPDVVWFSDDIFALSGKWAREFAACVEQADARTPFRVQSRCDLMTRDTVAALRESGCAEVWMGVESGSQRVLDAMDKGIRVEHVYAARENLRRHGIRACYFLQLGYLGEEWEDIEATIRLVRETRPDDIGVSVSYPLPNTRFYQIVQTQLGGKTNWSDSADLEMMFRGAFPSAFYRAVADALHIEVRGDTGAVAGSLSEAWDRVEHLRCVYC